MTKSSQYTSLFMALSTTALGFPTPSSELSGLETFQTDDRSTNTVNTAPTKSVVGTDPSLSSGLMTEGFYDPAPEAGVLKAVIDFSKNSSSAIVNVQLSDGKEVSVLLDQIKHAELLEALRALDGIEPPPATESQSSRQPRDAALSTLPEAQSQQIDPVDRRNIELISDVIEKQNAQLEASARIEYNISNLYNAVVVLCGTLGGASVLVIWLTLAPQITAVVSKVKHFTVNCCGRRTQRPSPPQRGTEVELNNRDNRTGEVTLSNV